MGEIHEQLPPEAAAESVIMELQNQHGARIEPGMNEKLLDLKPGESISGTTDTGVSWTVTRNEKVGSFSIEAGKDE